MMENSSPPIDSNIGAQDGRAGFTLVELLISMLVLAIGIMAVLAMQFTALGSSMISRDNANAADIAQRVMHIIRVEGQQWRNANLAIDVSKAAYDESAFSSSPLLPNIVGSGFTSLFTEPLDARMSTRGVTRYCAFGRADEMTTDLYHIQIAVVFPAANGVIADDDCAALTGEFDLDPSLNPVDDRTHAQRNGYRVQYFDTHIARRGHLL
jgi:prepilin-type N-terminal cleavage/methylation domain-containing protein